MCETSMVSGAFRGQVSRESGWAFYEAVANTIGLVTLLNDHISSEQDL